MMFQIQLGLRQTVIFGFASYGAAIAYDSNPRLATQVGTIYQVVQLVLTRLLLKQTKPLEVQYRLNRVTLATDFVAIVACKALNLIGNRGFAIFTAVSLLRFAINSNFRFFPERD